ncbi:hypothetical protein V6N13_114148 [Hibiscus sabdariffa]|uniref:Uncharacterized protein n=1 Tax=Hibiscus sabdariffa TaxID=183260 RepID=A0ABR2U1P4_9ROSI
MRNPSDDPKDCSNVGEKPLDNLDPRESGKGLSLGDGMHVDVVVPMGDVEHTILKQQPKIEQANSSVERNAYFDGMNETMKDDIVSMEVRVTSCSGSGSSKVSYAAMVFSKAKVHDVSKSISMVFDVVVEDANYMINHNGDFSSIKFLEHQIF